MKNFNNLERIGYSLPNPEGGDNYLFEKLTLNQTNIFWSRINMMSSGDGGGGTSFENDRNKEFYGRLNKLLLEKSSGFKKGEYYKDGAYIASQLKQLFSKTIKQCQELSKGIGDDIIGKFTAGAILHYANELGIYKKNFCWAVLFTGIIPEYSEAFIAVYEHIFEELKIKISTIQRLNHSDEGFIVLLFDKFKQSGLTDEFTLENILGESDIIRICEEFNLSKDTFYKKVLEYIESIRKSAFE